MKTKDIYMYVLGGVIVIAVLGIIALLVFNEVPQTNREVLGIVLGTLVGAFSSVVNYFFGSSRGSADKTEILTKNGNGEKP